jgi:hypothetical protein
VCEQDRNAGRAVSNRWLARESIAPRDDDRNANALHRAMARFFQGDGPEPRQQENANMNHLLMKRAPILFGIAALVACGSDSTAPSTVAGTYLATQFVTTGSSGQTNQLLAGSSLLLHLAANGSVSGQLHIAATNGNPVADADMAGTWAQTGNTITFTQAADTFVRNMTFAIVATGSLWELVGDGGPVGTRIQITLTQQATL